MELGWSSSAPAARSRSAWPPPTCWPPTAWPARVVSFPSWDLFAAQDEGYRREVLPDGVPRLAVEAASPFGWERYADATVGIDHFGASAPGDVAMEEFGFTPQHVATEAAALVAGRSAG